MSTVNDGIVLAELLPIKQGAKLGILTLNKPKSLNALDLQMVESLLAKLKEWEADSSVKAVILKGAGEKAFCAGGDVVSMYKSMVEERRKQAIEPTTDLARAPAFLQDFFTREYELDFYLANYPKALICWGNGIVMGGGLGLFAASAFSVVTESSRIAMPEITIGLFPDVGGSYFLNRMPAGLGLFLGVTGASFNAIDAKELRLASHAIDADLFSSLIEGLSSLENISHDAVRKQLELLEAKSKVVNKLSAKLVSLSKDLATLDTCTNSQELTSVIHGLVEKHPGNTWLQKASATLDRGSPITVRLVIEQLIRAKSMSLAEAFQQELSMALSCSLYGEFQEGVRALLIDKDQSPRWRYSSAEHVPDSLIEAHFNYFNDENNPLSHLSTR
ncbi:enoyl-CoA hydratase/isomerase family protein [Glaciecola sp. MH2013]|uniref:enoyl-CoA hydratase/isomerase family protein n=1 Tax=Glaciecola sp. MH2013 TaxID=2785524 RepID=UPI00189CD2B8|nr:enoyl-CoA hydratase/isomerase family protein [Glaciecola sp. MH2013]MBF7072706.1 enoyl-CoA hydratase/isomerase family protein [Glaciecola sp. MH2013]